MDSNKLNLPPPEPLPGRSLAIPYVLVGDDAFALRPNLMKPYNQRELTMVQRVHNYRLSRARHVIENVFGLMASRFGVLQKSLHLDANKTKKVVLACSVLHNYLITTDRTKYAPPRSFDRYSDENEFIPGEWRHDLAEEAMNDPSENLSTDDEPSSSAKVVQNEFLSYFVEEGEIEWQYRHL